MTQQEPVHLRTPLTATERWTGRLLLSAGASGAVGAFAAAMVRLGFRGLQWCLTGSGAEPPQAAIHLSVARRIGTPVLGALAAMAILWLQHHFTGKVQQKPHVDYVEAVRRDQGSIPFRTNVWRTGSAAFSVASGAAIGREGSMIQFAAAASSVWSRGWQRWTGEPRVTGSLLVACGVVGGVTAAYNAPVAAFFFAVEIVLGGFTWRALPGLALAAVTGLLVSGPLLGWHCLYPATAPLAPGAHLYLLPILACVAGLLGPAYQWLLKVGKVAQRLPVPLLWSGLLVGALSVIDVRVWGNGQTALQFALSRAPDTASGALTLLRILGLRLLATPFCLWTGTVGGVFTPTLFAGGTIGALLGHVLLPGAAVLWAIAGMSFLLAAVTHAPIMAACMAAEVTGDWTLLPLLLVLNYISFGIARRLSPMALYSIASQAPHSISTPVPPPSTTPAQAPS